VVATFPNAIDSFWRLDLADPTLTVVTFGSEFDARRSPQIAFDQNGELWANFPEETTLWRVNQTTGALSDSVTLGPGLEFFDMASIGTTDEERPPSSTPEPSTLVLAMLGLLSLAARRRKRKQTR
jgi:hypothetical protein